MNKVKTYFCTLVLLVMAATSVMANGAGQHYDLLFREGTLDAIDRSAALVYRRDVTNALRPDAAERDTGQIALSFGDAGKDMAQLQFRRDDKKRGLGRFPASVGNPMIMYFYESVIRDMAESAGGSSFYIRNRVKDALLRPTDIETGEAEFGGKTVPTQTVRLYPFLDDPNKDRMQGFGDLVLSVTMSEAVPGWYLSLVAEADGETEPVYRSELVFDRLEEGS
jgi:hypothetical protein